MREAMIEERVKPRVTKHYFEPRSGSGITGKSCVYLFPQVFKKHRNPYLC
jgi:hypothetical protein